jgi:hypothetical protein
MISLFALALLVSLTMACGSEPRFWIDVTAKRQFVSLPGKIGIAIKSYSREWYQVINQGNLVIVDSLPKAAYEASGNYGSGATGLAPLKGYEYRGPYLTSPDKRYIAASVAVGPSDPAPWGLVIIDIKTRSALAQVSVYKNRYYLDGLAWSPDSKLIAVLKHSSRTGYGPADLIALMSGHGVPYMTYYLDVIDLSGNLVAHTKLSSEVRASWGWVVWTE